MIRVDKELIQKELERDINKGYDFHYQKPSNKFIDWLFRHYYIHEIVENFYDSEPDFDDEEFKMYMDYRDTYELTGMTFWHLVTNLDEIREKKEKFKYSKEPHTVEELKAAYDKVIQMYKDYEDTRMVFNNWQEPYFKGNCGMSQEYVDSVGRRIFARMRNFPKSIKNRLYIAKKDDQIRVYFYGRDLWKADYWFIFMKRKRRL